MISTCNYKTDNNLKEDTREPVATTQALKKSTNLRPMTEINVMPQTGGTTIRFTDDFSMINRVVVKVQLLIDLLKQQQQLSVIIR